MVEANPPKTQLPTSAQSAAANNAQEESKEESQYMYGTAEDVMQDIMDRLEGVELNQLEEGLLERFL